MTPLEQALRELAKNMRIKAANYHSAGRKAGGARCAAPLHERAYAYEGCATKLERILDAEQKRLAELGQ